MSANLNCRAAVQLLGFLVVLACLLFLTAGTVDYWQAWLFLAVYFGSASAITVYLAKKDPELLERRMKAGPGAEKERGQKIIQALALAAFLSALVLPAFDVRFGWSKAPAWVAITGDGLMVVGLLIVFLVFRENSFTSGVIEVDAGQVVVSTGPYAVVRHPMYSGALIMMAGVPLALGSWWGLLATPAMLIVIVWRLLDEEKLLARKLPGYETYLKTVRRRLAPFVW